MTTFVLVHGAWHGGWCWQDLGVRLAHKGHEVIAMDMPGEDGEATLAAYTSTVLRSLGAEPPTDLILVGHSLGGMVIPMVAAQVPARAMVWVCGLVPKLAGRPWDDGPPMEEPGAFDGVIPDPAGGSRWSSLEAATHAFYHDCTPEQAAWAYERLRRHNGHSLWKTPYPLNEWPEGERVSIAAVDDRAVTLDWARHVTTTRLGIDPIEIPGGHSPFLSQPDVLCNLLTQRAAGR